MPAIFLIILLTHSLNSNLKRSGKILSFHWFSARWKMHTQIQISIDSQKSARLPGEWDTERRGQGAGLVWSCSWQRTWTCHLSVLLRVSLVSLSGSLSMSLLATAILSLLKMDTCQLLSRRESRHMAFFHCRDLMQHNLICSHFHGFWFCFHCSPPAPGTKFGHAQ